MPVAEFLQRLKRDGYEGAVSVELNPDASALAQQVGLEDGGGVAAPTPTDTTSFEIPADTDSEIFATDDTFSTGEAFEVPAASLDEFQEADL